MSDSKTPATKDERLAARLRENLRRRKAQARESAAHGGDPLPKPRDKG